MITFQYNLNRKNHFISLLKGQLKTISIFLIIFTFCYFAINLEAFLYVFPLNVPLVLITYIVYLSVMLLIMLLISLVFLFLMTIIFKKNNAYKIYNYKIDKDKLFLNNNVIINLSEVKNIKITKRYIKIISFKLKQVITFEKFCFSNIEDFNKLKNYLKKEKNNLEVV